MLRRTLKFYVSLTSMCISVLYTISYTVCIDNRKTLTKIVFVYTAYAIILESLDQRT